MGSQNNRVKSFLEAHLLPFQASSELSVTAWAPTGRPAQKPGCIVNHPLRCVITPCHQLLEATSAVTKDSPRCLTFLRGSSTSGWGRSPEMRSIKESLLEKVFCVTIHPTPFWGFPGTSGWKKKKKNLPTNAGDTRDMGSILRPENGIPWSRKWQPTPIFLPG